MSVSGNPSHASNSQTQSFKAAPTRRNSPRARSGGWGFGLFAAGIVIAVSAGWIWRDSLSITPEEGIGYWLGIAGMSCVGLLLIYPIRKRLPKLGFIGSVPVWFHLHMALGLLAPALILYHATFRTGSMNAEIALTAMLIVAGSGIVGRLIYVRVHRGLTGQKKEVRSLAVEAAGLRDMLAKDFTRVADIAASLEKTLHKPRPSAISAFAYAISASARISAAERQMLSAIRRGSRDVASKWALGRNAADRLRRESSALVRAYCETLRKAAYLTFFERLFALWHVMHLPLFVLMLVAAVIHVVAVHLY